MLPQDQQEWTSVTAVISTKIRKIKKVKSEPESHWVCASCMTLEMFCNASNVLEQVVVYIRMTIINTSIVSLNKFDQFLTSFWWLRTNNNITNTESCCACTKDVFSTSYWPVSSCYFSLCNYLSLHSRSWYSYLCPKSLAVQTHPWTSSVQDYSILDTLARYMASQGREDLRVASTLWRHCSDCAGWSLLLRRCLNKGDIRRHLRTSKE
jgi:hypothetical protein